MARDNETLGAGVRSIHQACQKVLKEHLDMNGLKGEEKATVEVPAGFDPSAIRLTGNVTGSPPFKGTLDITAGASPRSRCRNHRRGRTRCGATGGSGVP